MPRTRILQRLMTLIATLALAGLIAGCGGSSDDSSSTAPAADDSNTPAEQGDSNKDANAAGKSVFESAGCAGCHTLSAAGAKGTSGPDLDNIKDSKEKIEAQVKNGGGGMPAFGDRLSAQEISDVAAFVADNDGS